MNYKKLFIGIMGGVIILIVAGWIFNSSPLAEQGRLAPSSFPGAFDIVNPLRSEKGAFSVPEDASSPPSPSLTDKKIIKNGSLTLVVDAADVAVSAVTKLAQEKEGFVESLHLTDKENGGKQAFMTLRIPVARFSETMEALKALANLVEDEQVSGQDVTEQFIDLEARLGNLKATEAQFLETLKRAFTIKDILEVQDRLSQVRGDIESLEGQLKYLANQTDLATIHVTLSEEPTVTLSLRDFRPITILKTSVNALLQGLIVVFNLLVQFIIVWIPLILVGVILLGILLWIGRAIGRALKNKFVGHE